LVSLIYVSRHFLSYAQSLLLSVTYSKILPCGNTSNSVYLSMQLPYQQSHTEKLFTISLLKSKI
jgi:hypothetical protein